MAPVRRNREHQVIAWTLWDRTSRVYKMLRMAAWMAEEAVPASSHRSQKRGSGFVKELGV
jgi:hypothetical protein